MILVLPSALPPAPFAPELGQRLPQVAPTLATWLGSAPAQPQHLPPADTCCTPVEAWQLERAGFTPPAGMPLGAGWAVLLQMPNAPDPDQPLWLADLAHFHVTHQGVTLFDPAQLEISPEDGNALQDMAFPLLEDLGIGAASVSARRMQLSLPAGLTPYAPTPSAVANQDIHHWWPQTSGYRPWRQALNLVQMAWHDHPVNHRREARGLPPINGLWLYGGARPSDFSPKPFKAGSPVFESGLIESASQGDWATWLNTLEELDRSHLRPLHERLLERRLDMSLVLTGEERLVRLELPARRGIKRWLPQRRLGWRSWWDAA